MSRTADCVLAGNGTLATVIWFLARSWLYFRLRCCSVFVFNIPLPSLAFIKICFPSATTLIHFIAPLYFLTALTATSHYSSTDLFSFCFPNVDHVMFSREFDFYLFINRAFHFQVNTRVKDDI